MPVDQYHEPPEELSAEIRTFARMIASLQEEAEAIGWYTQRILLEKDVQAKAIMRNALQQESKQTSNSCCVGRRSDARSSRKFSSARETSSRQAKRPEEAAD